MQHSEAEWAELEIAHRRAEQQEIFRRVRFADLMAQVVARRADGSIDGWREYLSDELKRLEFSDTEIRAELKRLESR